MAKPSYKSEDMERTVDRLLGVNRRETIEADQCTTCPGKAKDFRDDLSRKEYTISGMCQACQDSVFGGPS